MSKKDVIKILIIVAVIVLAIFLVGRMDKAHSQKELDLVKSAVRNAALTCYAVEGAYPQNLDYLRENYQLAYDEDKFFVTYNAFAPNVIPSIFVTQKGAELNR